MVWLGYRKMRWRNTVLEQANASKWTAQKLSLRLKVKLPCYAEYQVYSRSHLRIPLQPRQECLE